MGDAGMFGPQSVTWRVHVEPIMWVAGLRALYLQSLHPRVMRGTYQNSALFDNDKAWDRFLRTAQYVNIRTYGTTAEVAEAAGRVRAIHAGLSGFDPDTAESFRLNEPAGLLWVHCAEIDSYIDIAYRAGVVNAAEADRYVDENRRAAEVVGLDPEQVPRDRAQLADYFAGIAGSLYACSEARQSMRRSFNPPLPARLAVLRLAAPAACALAMGALPGWARRKFSIPALPGADIVTTAQLRALRLASGLIRTKDTERAIADARKAAHEMAAGTFRSTLSR